MWEEISRAELLCGVRKMKICAVVGWFPCVLGLSCWSCPAQVSAAPGALGTVGSVLGEVFNMKTKFHQPGDQEKGLGFCNTAGSWDSEV